MTLHEYLVEAKKPSDINEHLDILMEYGNRCKKIVEFGVRWADGSTIAFLNTNKDIIVESYDIVNTVEKRIKDLTACTKKEKKPWTFVLKSSLEADIDTDMMFIDTFHVYDLLKSELSRHCDHVHKYIAMHDTTLFAYRGEDGSTGKGLMTALTEFLNEHPEWKIAYKVENNNGLTILERE